MAFVIKHPTKGFFQKDGNVKGGVWVGSNHAAEWAWRFESLEKAEEKAIQLTSLSGKPLKKLSAVSIIKSGQGRRTFLTEAFHKQLS